MSSAKGKPYFKYYTLQKIIVIQFGIITLLFVTLIINNRSSERVDHKTNPSKKTSLEEKIDASDIYISTKACKVHIYKHDSVSVEDYENK